MMTSSKSIVRLIGLSCIVTLPVSVQAATWSTGTVDQYTIKYGSGPEIVPFTIGANARADSLFINANGEVGLGAEVPDRPGDENNPRLYIVGQTPDIELDDIDDPQVWQIFANGGDGSDDLLGGIGFYDWTASTLPFFIQSTAPEASLVIRANGQIGVGTFHPQSQLHVVDDQFAYYRPLTIENTSGRGFSGFSLKIASDSWIDFNNSGGKFRINADQKPGAEFEVRPNGDATLRGALTQNSDVNAKQDIVAIYQDAVLAKVMSLPISEWSYIDNPDTRHIGPMAQDFYRLFALGDNNKGISSIDTGGVALAAIQGVKKEKDQQIATLIAEQKAEIGALRAEFDLQIVAQDERIMQLELALTELLRKQSTEVQVGAID